MTAADAAILMTATGPNFGLLTAQKRAQAWTDVLDRATTYRARAVALDRVTFWLDVADRIKADNPEAIA